MQKRFEINDTSIEGLKLLHRIVHSDERGYFERLFCMNELSELLNGREIQQVNHTLTKEKGVVRGMHFQYPPHAETKFVSCLKGSVFDVAIDLRRESPTFLQWHAELLTDENHNTLLIPEGFAHGFQTLTTNCELMYFHTEFYEPEVEGALNALDPVLAINWPEEVSGLSPKDQAHPFVRESFEGIEV